MFVALGVDDFLERGRTVYRDRTAVVDEPGQPGGLGTITYGELGRRADALAGGLEEAGVGHGERVAILSPNAGKMLVSLFGVSGSGRVLVPINFRLSAAEVGYILDHSGASALLVDPEYADLVADAGVKVRVVLDGADDDALFGGPGGVAGPRVPWTADEAATATINYTSGTTARPKGVQLSHRSLWMNATLLGLHVGVGDRDVYLHTLPTFHVNGWGMPYVLSAFGVPQVVLRKVDGEEILSRIETHGVTLLCGAPAVVASVLSAAGLRRAAGRPVPGSGTDGRARVRIVVAGAPPPSQVIEAVETELGWEFIQLYGLTETSPLLTLNRATPEDDALAPAERARRLGRAGPPALGVRLRLDPGGEIEARANQVFDGYWDQPEQTAAAVPDGWFRTGDGGWMDDAHLVIADRKKDVIITGGENVSSIEVEDCLYSHPAVAEAAVIGVPDARWGETVKALVVLGEGVSVEPAELIAHCRGHLAHYKCPTSVEFRDRLERTATGKLQKFKLRSPYWAGEARQVH